ncbi:MAG: glycosyltransferase family 2 protein [Chloroflexota bacterium]|nr:glycosyltransferase family 2 protein [Chloroflexota bacterium]MDE2910898.1 glycosyltransferase family 2 protein [Chloroflexota bacterium]
MPDLSVVIVSYNTRDLLRSCLQSLRASVGLDLEIIVVDNASSDGSAEMARGEFPEARLLAQTLNTWYCGGNNIGIKAARADAVLLLNPDTEVAPDALALLYRFLLDNPDYVGVTAQLIYPNGETQRTCARIPEFRHLLFIYTILGYLLPTTKRELLSDVTYGDWDRLADRDVEAAPGACTMMRRADVWLDDNLLLYFPEETLARRHQKPMRFLAAARIKHHEKSSTQSWFATSIFFRDLLVYCRAHHGVARMLLLWALSRPLYWLMWLKNRLPPP